MRGAANSARAPHGLSHCLRAPPDGGRPMNRMVEEGGDPVPHQPLATREGTPNLSEDAALPTYGVGVSQLCVACAVMMLKSLGPTSPSESKSRQYENTLLEPIPFAITLKSPGSTHSPTLSSDGCEPNKPPVLSKFLIRSRYVPIADPDVSFPDNLNPSTYTGSSKS